MKIDAAIVTYNRLDFLKRLITALKEQTLKPNRIIVVNNSSTDGTNEYLESISDVEVILQPNAGSSGGQFTASKYCYETGSEWIWLMDDDVIPQNDVLEKLAQNINERTIHVPLRINPDGKVNQGDTLELNYSNPFKSVWRKILSSELPTESVIEAQGITFEGPLFHRSLIDKIGLPEFGFFIYGDDTDYFSRAVSKGYQCRIICDAVSNRLLPVLPMERFDWKTYYMIRNQIALDVLNAPTYVRALRPLGYLISWFKRAKGNDEKEIVLKAFFDGYFYKKHQNNIDFDNKYNIHFEK